MFKWIDRSLDVMMYVSIFTLRYDCPTPLPTPLASWQIKGNHHIISTESVQSVILEMVTKLWKQNDSCIVMSFILWQKLLFLQSRIALKIKFDLKQFQKNYNGNLEIGFTEAMDS